MNTTHQTYNAATEYKSLLQRDLSRFGYAILTLSVSFEPYTRTLFIGANAYRDLYKIESRNIGFNQSSSTLGQISRDFMSRIAARTGQKISLYAIDTSEKHPKLVDATNSDQRFPLANDVIDLCALAINTDPNTVTLSKSDYPHLRL